MLFPLAQRHVDSLALHRLLPQQFVCRREFGGTLFDTSFELRLRVLQLVLGYLAGRDVQSHADRSNDLTIHDAAAPCRTGSTARKPLARIRTIFPPAPPDATRSRDW